MKTLVLGLGNPILGDDAVGLRVVRIVREKISDGNVSVVESTASGLGLLDVLTGFDQVVVVDAIQTKGGRVGDVYRLTSDALNATRHSASPHDTNLSTALELGRRLGLVVPKHMAIVAIEISPECREFTEELSPEVEEALPRAVEAVMKEVSAS